MHGRQGISDGQDLKHIQPAGQERDVSFALTYQSVQEAKQPHSRQVTY